MLFQKLIYLYLFCLFLAVLDLHCYVWAFLYLQWAGATLHCGAQALSPRASVSCGSQALEYITPSAWLPKASLVRQHVSGWCLWVVRNEVFLLYWARGMSRIGQPKWSSELAGLFSCVRAGGGIKGGRPALGMRSYFRLGVVLPN